MAQIDTSALTNLNEADRKQVLYRRIVGEMVQHPAEVIALNPAAMLITLNHAQRDTPTSVVLAQLGSDRLKAQLAAQLNRSVNHNEGRIAIQVRQKHPDDRLQEPADQKVKTDTGRAGLECDMRWAAQNGRKHCGFACSQCLAALLGQTSSIPLI